MNKHRIFFVVLFFSFRFALPAFDVGRMSFFVQPNIGLLTGRMQEFVYARQGVLSRLDWEHTAIPFASLDTKLIFYNVFMKFNVTAGLPSKTGYLEDRDFMTYTKNPTHYSRHDLQTQKLVLFSIFAGYDFQVRRATLSPSLGVIFKWNKWNARNGYGLYSISTPYKELPSLDFGNYPGVWSFTSDFANKDVITYEQNIYLLALGFDVNYKINKRFALLASANFFPHMYVEALDFHHLRNLQFYDYMLGGLGASIDIGMEIFKFCLSLKYEYYISFYGGSKYGSLGTHLANLSTEGAASGVASHVFTFSLGYKFE